MPPFEPPNLFHLSAAVGWLGLGNHLEANEELEKITPELRSHPAVLEIRFEIYAKEQKWDACRDIGNALVQTSPLFAISWCHAAFATRRATGGSIEAAKEILIEARQKFPKDHHVAFNLACYECQLGNYKEAETLLESAIDLAPDPKAVKLAALEDRDLEPLWLNIGEI